MVTEVRPGDYRVCPKCGTRHKVQDLRCTKCQGVLAGTPVHHAFVMPATPATARASRALRIVLVLGLVIAVGAGLWMRSLFRGAQLEESVQAANATAAPVTEPQPQPSWSPPVLQYPPMVGYNRGVPASMAGLAIAASPAPAAAEAPTGMTSIAPPSEPTRKTTF